MYLLQVSHSSPLSQKERGRQIQMQMAETKKSAQGRGMFPFVSWPVFSKTHGLNITLQIPLKNGLCALHCKKWWFWNQRQWITTWLSAVREMVSILSHNYNGETISLTLHFKLHPVPLWMEWYKTRFHINRDF